MVDWYQARVRNERVRPPLDDVPAHRVVRVRVVHPKRVLVLDHVRPGRYTLIALPLKLEGADGSPVRAALVSEDDSLPASLP